MKTAEIEVGKTYRAKISGQMQEVRIIRLGESYDGHWRAYGVNPKTGRDILIRSPRRLRSVVDADAAAKREEIHDRARGGAGRGVYPDRPTPNGSCHRCGKMMQKQVSLFCNRLCRYAYYDVPSEETLRDWAIMDGDCEATDGCRVEPDGTCPHGRKSWLLYFGAI